MCPRHAGRRGIDDVDVTRVGRAVVRKVTTSWNPQNGFDHVAFTVFFELPGRSDGATVMPLQNSLLPAGMRWHYRLRAHGWSNTMFSADRASVRQEGTLVSPSADIRVNRASDTVTFILPARSLGQLKSLSGVKVYVTTWDYDGGYRELGLTATHGSMCCGDPATDPLVMDDTPVITLP